LYTVLHGLMHSSEENHFPHGDKVPHKDENNWTQWCFRDLLPLGNKMMFVEFNINWKELVKEDMDYGEACQQK
jgi:hypothetical protein